MLVFIDESGDAGFRIDRGSSQIFAAAMVIFDDRGQALACMEALEKLRQKLGLREFKFNKSHAKVKSAFFEVVQRYDFKVRATPAPPALRRGERRRGPPNGFGLIGNCLYTPCIGASLAWTLQSLETPVRRNQERGPA